MKVLYVLSGTTIFGGATKAFLNLLSGIQEAGVTPLCLCPDKNGIYNELVNRGIDVLVSNIRFTTWPPRKGLKNKVLFIPRLLFHSSLNVVAYYRLLRFARQEKPDIIHTNVSVVDLGYRVAQKLSIPHVWHVREYGDFDFEFDFAPSYSSYLRHLNSEGNYCIAITQGVKEHHGLSDEKCEVIYDGVMSESDCKYIARKESFFLFAGRLEEAKGIEMCLRSYVRYWKETKTTTEMWVAGDAIESSYYTFLMEIAGDAPVKFMGMRKDIYSLMARSKALIVSSRHEGFGFITAEAMFNGCLVIGRNTSGTKEQMDNGLKMTGSEIALRFETEDELISKFKQVEEMGMSYYEDITKRAQCVVSELYSREKHNRRVLALYQRLLYK